MTPDLGEINKMSAGSMVEHLDIKFTEIGEDYIVASLPVDHRTHQPFGILHGGASVALAETLGSVASYLTVDPEKFYCVGLEINANHIRSKKDGHVFGKVKPIHLGRTTQLWEIRITDEQDKLICISRLTLAILNRK